MGTKGVVIVGILILLIAGAFFFLNREGSTTGSTITGSSIGVADTKGVPQAQETVSSAVREISIDAQRFTFKPAVIKLKEGERVRITVRNVDTTHGISIPEFNVRDAESVEFIASKKGNYPFYCANYCGEGHREMQGMLIVE